MAYRTDTMERVSNTPLRERYVVLYETEENLHHRICTRMVQAGYSHYMRIKKCRGGRRYLPDTTHLKRKLGVKGSMKDGKMYFPKTIGYEEAVELSRALDMDPVDAGV